MFYGGLKVTPDERFALIQDEESPLTSSGMRITDVQESDSGTYSCRSAAAEHVRIKFNVQVKALDTTSTTTASSIETSDTSETTDPPAQIWMNHFCSNVCALCH